MSFTGGPDTDYIWLSPSCSLKVSKLCFGTMTFGDVPHSGWNPPGQTSEAESHALLDRYIELGGNFIDTAIPYSYGEAERILGTWLAKQPDRDQLVVATKVRIDLGIKFGGTMTLHPNRVGLGRNAIIYQVEQALKRLQTHYIDLLQFHAFDHGTPLEETLRTVDDLVRSGKVRYIGGSNYTGWQLQKMVDLTNHMGLACKFITLQQQYNLLGRESELDSFQVCKNEGLGLIPYSPLKGGLLSGKFKQDQMPEPSESRVGWSTKRGMHIHSAPDFNVYKDDPKFWDIMNTLGTIAKNKGKTVSQVALRWVLQREPVTSVITGARTLQQLESNMAAVRRDWGLTTEEMEQLNKVSALPITYPYDFDIMLNNERVRHLGATV